MNQTKKELYDLSKQWIDSYKQEKTGTLYDWNASTVESFSRIPIETLIRDPYFLGFGDKVYDGVLEDIVALFHERKSRAINLAIFLEGIGCVNPETSWVWTSDGLELLSTVHANKQIATGNIPQLVLGRKFTKLKAYKIKTRSGFEIECSATHPLYKMFENGIPNWDKLENSLKIGDFVAIPHSYNLFGSKIIHPDLAWVLGCLIGDGCLMSTTIKMTAHQDDAFIVQECYRIIKTFFKDSKISIGPAKKKPHLLSLSITGKEFINFLKAEGIFNKNAFNKSIPNSILQGTKENWIGFLQGCFDTDGSSKDGGVHITSVSKTLIQQVQLALLNFGIISRIGIKKTSWQNGKSFTNRLKINSTSALKFYELIGFRLIRKQNKMQNFVDLKFNPNLDIVPHQSSILYDLWKRSGKTQQGFKTIMNPNYGKEDRDGQFPSREKLQRFYEKYCLDDLENLEGVFTNLIKERIEEKVFWDEVVEIIELEEKVLVDLAVDNLNYYIANGFKNHNSGKTVKSSIIMWLLWYELSLHTNPQEHFDLAPDSVIAIINMNRCVTGDTLIATSKGLIPIIKLKNMKNILCKTKDGWHKILSFHENGKKEVLKITSSKGFTLKCSKNHPLWNINQWQEAEKLKIGDYIAFNIDYQFGNNTYINPEQAYVLGMLIGDGYLAHERLRITWCGHHDDVEISNYMIEIIGKYWGHQTDIHFHSRKNKFEYRVTGNSRINMNRWLDSLDVRHTAEAKLIPQCIFESPKETIIELLKGLFDSDGSALNFRPRVRYTSINKDLVLQVQQLLLMLGIIGNVRKPKRKKANKGWTIHLDGLPALQFQQIVGFRLIRKQKALLDSFKSKTRGFYNLVPKFENIFTDSIESIEYGFDDTFDLTIQDDHSYIANGFIVHNTEKQSRKVTFGEVWNRFQTPFNRDYFPPSDKWTTEIRIPRNNTTIFPGTSSALSALGYNLYSGIIDEAAFLEVVEDSSKALDAKFDACEEMANAIMNRMVSRFLKAGNLPGLICMITSPNFPDDYVHKQIELADRIGINSGIFYRRRSTWEAKGAKFYPENEFFYIDTDSGDVIEDPVVTKLLNNIDKFPLEVDYEELEKIAPYFKED